MNKEEIDELEREYYEGLFEHRRQVEELYNEPLMSGLDLLVFVILLGILITLSWRWG